MVLGEAHYYTPGKHFPLSNPRAFDNAAHQETNYFIVFNLDPDLNPNTISFVPGKGGNVGSAPLETVSFSGNAPDGFTSNDSFMPGA